MARLTGGAVISQVIKAHPHPQLVGIVDVSAADGVLMEYWSEGDLQKQLATARRKYMPVEHIRRIVAHVLGGLQHLHRLKVRSNR